MEVEGLKPRREAAESTACGQPVASTNPQDPRYVVARKLHDLDCPAGAACRDEDMTWGKWYAAADAVLAAVSPVIRQQVADRIEDEIRRQVVAGAAAPLRPGSVLAAGGIVDWLMQIIRAAASQSTQPGKETNG